MIFQVSNIRFLEIWPSGNKDPLEDSPKDSSKGSFNDSLMGFSNGPFNEAFVGLSKNSFKDAFEDSLGISLKIP